MINLSSPKTKSVVCSNLCDFTGLYSRNLWNYITDVYKYSALRVSEVGITDDLVYEMIAFQDKVGVSVEAYINFGYNEKVSGADIELIIFDDEGFGSQYFIQAKRMTATGRFEIDKFDPKLPLPPDPKANQYLNLINYSTSKGGTPLYLLYCGESNGSKKGVVENGLSIIHAKNIAFHMEYRCKSGIPTFDSLYYSSVTLHKLMTELISLVPPFPSWGVQIHPFSHLFCGDTPSYLVPERKISMSDIDIEAPYEKIILKNTNNQTEDEGERGDERGAGLPKYKIIINKKR
jgi:hypothetical protein